MSCPEIKVDEIDGPFYERLHAEVIAAGGEFADGTAKISMCEFAWSYDPAARALYLSCTKKPFYASCEAVERYIREMIQKSREVQ